MHCIVLGENSKCIVLYWERIANVLYCIDYWERIANALYCIGRE